MDAVDPPLSPKHRDQTSLLIETLRRHVGPRPDIFIGGNVALYYSVVQARNNDFRAPDFMVVLDALPDRERKSRVAWEENSRVPDVVIELLSESTAATDRGRKRDVYAGLRVQAYYLFDPHTCTLEGLVLGGAGPSGRAYTPIVPNADGSVDCAVLGLRLAVHEGTFQGSESRWLRWTTPAGEILPTGDERAAQEKARAEQEKARAEQEKARADQEKLRADEEKARADEEKARAERLEARLRALGIDPGE